MPKEIILPPSAAVWDWCDAMRAVGLARTDGVAGVFINLDDSPRVEICVTNAHPQLTGTNK